MKPPHWRSTQIQGVTAALLSAAMLGLTPIFGKQAILEGVAPLSVVMLRTVIATAMLWLMYGLVWRRYLYIYPVGLMGCALAGLINGLGSVMYYNGLGRLDAALAQLLYTLYPIFLTLLSRLDSYPISRFTLFRLGLGLFAVYLLKWSGPTQADGLGALLMIGAGALYALHLAVNQRVLYDVPAPTVTLYTLTAMTMTVAVAYGLSGRPALPGSVRAWEPVMLLTLVTLVSRLMLFMGVKHLGSLQTTLLGLSEALVTLVAAMLLLDEKFTPVQWVGAALLAVSVLLVVREKSLGSLPQPKPWLQIFRAWFDALFPKIESPPAPKPLSKPAAPPSSSERLD